MPRSRLVLETSMARPIRRHERKGRFDISRHMAEQAGENRVYIHCPEEGNRKG
jgi:hypothetical protein